ncbi:hypothetical protein ACN38_g8289, partial [Penicillium nordicum]
RGIWV